MLLFNFYDLIYLNYKNILLNTQTCEMQSQCQKQLIQIYRHLHQIPQIGLHEYKTTEFIKQYIQKIEGAQILLPQIQTQLKTGLVALVRTQANTNTNQNNKYLFRCDIDALNFKQQSGLQFSSKNGLHHACGHDAHTSIMLIALKNIARNRKDLKRDIYFCFQPGQEGCGGATKLLQQYPSLLSKVEHCFALHVANFKQKQILLIPKQYVTANSNRFTIQIFGKSAHCMMPNTAIDANYIGCQVVNQIYSLKSRLINPSTGLAISVTKIQGGNDNITSISEYMKISGSVRSFSKQDHQKYTKCLCEINGAKYKFEVNRNWYRAVKNQQSAINMVKKAASTVFQRIQMSDPSFAGQDFCQFSQKVPSCYFVLAVGLPESLNTQTLQSKYPIHSNKFKLNQSFLWKGAQVWFNLAMQ